MKFFHCFCSCRETHIWTGISKSKCEGLSHFCTGVLCHVILCCNLWALNLAWSLGYLSSSAPLYAPCFVLVWLHFILDSLPTKGTSSRETSARPVSWGFYFFPRPYFHVFSLCSEEGPCSSLWGSGSHGWREQPHWQHNTLFLCMCWHSFQSSGSGTREGLSALLLVTLCSPPLLPPRQDPKPLKDHFLVFVFNVNSQASLCVQCEIIPNFECDNPSFFLCISLMYPFCSLVPCFSPLPLETCLRCGYCGAFFLATYPTAGWRWPLSYLQFYMAFMFWQGGTTKKTAP